VNSPRSSFSLRRALGEGPEALAVVLAGLWLAGTVVVPLEHAAEHASAERAHCHAAGDGAGPVCHGGDGSERSAAPTVRDGSAPELGAWSACHGALVAAPITTTTIALPARALVAVSPIPAVADVHTGRVALEAAARGPPAAPRS
jgi:hypothetical protein